MKVPKTIQRAVVERVSGGKPSRLRATMGAAMAGGLVAATVYRGLRS